MFPLISTSHTRPSNMPDNLLAPHMTYSTAAPSPDPKIALLSPFLHPVLHPTSLPNPPLLPSFLPPSLHALVSHPHFSIRTSPTDDFTRNPNPNPNHHPNHPPTHSRTPPAQPLPFLAPSSPTNPRNLPIPILKSQLPCPAPTQPNPTQHNPTQPSKQQPTNQTPTQESAKMVSVW